MPRLIASSPTWCAIAEARGEKIGQVGAALALQPELVLLDGLADLVVADRRVGRVRGCAGP